MPDVTVRAGEVSSGLVTLTPNQVSTVTFTEDLGFVTVIHSEAGSGMVWYTTDGSTPVIGGRSAWPLPAGMIDERRPTVHTSEGDVVKLISSGSPTVIVTRG